MKKISIFFCLAIAFLTLLSGCENFLDKIPDERTDLNTIDKISALLTTAYPQASFAAIVNYRCDYVTDFGSNAYGEQPISLLDFASDSFYWRERIRQGNDTEEEYWSACYKAIAASNHAIYAIESLPNPVAAKSQKAEALMTRAYSHFSLVSLFSHMYKTNTASLYPGIPYVIEPEDVPIKRYDRETVGQTYEKIEKDFNAAFKDMTDGGGFVAPKYHFNDKSASAFATRFFLFKGDYASVIRYANNLIPTPSLFIDIKDDEGNNLLNADGTPVVNLDPNDNAISYFSRNSHPVLSEYLKSADFNQIKTSFCSSKNYGNLLVTEMITTQALADNYGYARFGMGRNDGTLVFSVNNGTKGDWGYMTIAYGSKFYLIPKFSYELKKASVSATSGTPYSVLPVFRTEEVLLNRAEAYVMTDQYDKALADLNIFLSQRLVVNFNEANLRVYDPETLYLSKDGALESTLTARSNSEHFINKYNPTEGWSDLKKALILLVLQYRHAEFWHEGLRWYDILRWNIPVKHTLFNGSSNTLMPDDDRRVLQIPEAAVLSGVELNERRNVNDTWN